MSWLGYSRVSRVGKRGDRLISPEVQQRRIQSYAEVRGLAVEMLDPELDVSGGKVSRPVLDAAIRRVEAGEAEGIIVAQLDRLSRMQLADALAVIERIEAGGGGVIAVAENVDPTTPEGRLARNIFLSMAEHQRARYGEHIATSKRQAVERGIWPMPVVPRGYALGTDRHLEPGPDAPRVREAFGRRAGGAPWREIAELLGCGHSGAAKLIGNRVYLGEVRLTIDGELAVNRAAHEPLVSRDSWEAAQVSHPRPPRGSRGPALLAGLVRCASCSRMMSPGDGTYRCFPRKASGNCPAPAQIVDGPLEAYVEQLVVGALQGYGLAAVEVDAVTAELAALEEAEAELDAFQDAVSAAQLGAEHVGRGLRQRSERVEAARASLARARSRAPEVGLRGGADFYGALGVEERRHVLGSAIDVIWVRKGRGIEGRVRIVPAGQGPQGLSRPGVAAPPVAVEWDDLPSGIGAPAPADGEQTPE